MFGTCGRTATRPNKALAVYAAVVNVLETWWWAAVGQ
jgi:hypothetical protein